MTTNIGELYDQYMPIVACVLAFSAAAIAFWKKRQQVSLYFLTLAIIIVAAMFSIPALSRSGVFTCAPCL